MLEDKWSRWIAEANAVLAAYADCDARWWLFGPPYNTFQLVVGEPTGENVAIMLCRTKYIAGPTSWHNQKLKVSGDSNFSGYQMNRTFCLEDAAAGFRAESATFHWAKNVKVMDHYKWCVWLPTE
ncbi:MAG: hypothetical protein JWN70_699 [Planctomycetaceae bacterium]|nr:hypothetical protein [Planctomycetaceae bacterium]